MDMATPSFDAQQGAFCTASLQTPPMPFKFELNNIVKCWLLARYDQGAGYLNLSGICNDKELATVVSQLPPAKRPMAAKISFAVDYWTSLIFSSIYEHLPNVTSINLASNALKSLSPISNLIKKDEYGKSKRANRNISKGPNNPANFVSLFAKIQSLSLSDNELSSIDEVREFVSLLYSNSECKLAELLVSGNPAIKASSVDVIFPPTPIVLIFFSFALKFPKLSILDGVSLDVIRQSVNMKMPLPSSFDVGLQEILSPFLQALITGLDSHDRTSLKSLYSNHSEARISFYPMLFSESAISGICRPPPDLATVGAIWAHIQKSLLTSSQKKDLFLLGHGEAGKPDPVTFQKSPSNISEFLSQLPPIKHLMESLSVIAFNGRPLFIPEGGEIPVIQVFFSGLFCEGSCMLS